jgi:hypothetical protein
MRLQLLQPGLLGTPFAYDGSISKELWRDMVHGRSPRFRNKLYHALKW